MVARYTAAISRETAQKLRDEFEQGKKTIKRLAVEYQISYPTARRIAHGEWNLVNHMDRADENEPYWPLGIPVAERDIVPAKLTENDKDDIKQALERIRVITRS
mgnify:CR=1 FL=1